MRRLGLWVVAGIVIVAGARDASAQQCLPMLDKLARPLIQQALKLGQSRICRKAPRYSVTRSVRLTALQACFDRRVIVLDGTVDVTCATPKDALIPGQMREIVDFSADFDLAACRLGNVRAEPRSAMGKLIAGNLGMKKRLERQLNRRLAMFCRF